MSQSLEERFIAAYDEHADAIFRFCYVQTRQRDLALDLVQEAFTRVWQHLSRGNTVRDLRPFLYATARHVIADHYRKTPPQSLDALREDGFDVADDCAPDPLLAAETSRAIRLIGSLEPAYREAVLMRYVDELMPRDIARLTGESENVISVRITRGIGKLRELLKL